MQLDFLLDELPSKMSTISWLSFKEFRKNGGTVIRGSTECFFSIVDSRRVYAFCVENSPETMEKLGLVGAIGVVLLCGVCLGRALLFLSPPVVRR